MNVEWKEINPDYIVSSDGRVGSRRSGSLRMLHPTRNQKSYLSVWMHIGGERTYHKVHTLVAEAFLGPKPTPVHQVNHKNGARDDNHDRNLEWVTQSENMRHRFDVLGGVGPRGERARAAKLTEINVREIRAGLASGERPVNLARSFKVSLPAICDIAKRRTWAWLK